MRTKTLSKIISLILINGLTALIIFQIGLSQGKNSPTEAQTATPNYTAIWTPVRCRNLTGVDDGKGVNISLGVAEWQVEYGGDISGKEKWVVDGWVDKYTEEPAFKYEKHEVRECVENTTGGSGGRVSLTGLYGYTFFAGGGLPVIYSTGVSYPKSWKVSKIN